jgi:hypothetical protein
MTEPNTEAVRLALVQAAPVTAPAEGEDRGGGGDGGWYESRLPAECPVTPLGVTGQIHHYLDALNQHREISARDHSRLALLSLFGHRTELLYQHWPRTNDKGATTGWKPELVAEALVAETARKGVIDVHDKVRGVGAWSGDDGELVLHCGDKVLQGASPVPDDAADDPPRWRAPGAIGEHIYPAGPPRPRPADGYAAGGSGGPAASLLQMLEGWNWGRSDVDPMLLLGWVMAALVGGALKWRPAVWVTGDRGTGKSTLHDLLKLVFGQGGIFSVSDSTAAGIRQHTGHASLPVAIDELEADDDNRRAKQVIELARLAASGAVTYRGGADHQGREFTIRSAFLFSSILVPPLSGQDRSRLAILELQELGRNAAPPRLDARKLRMLGQLLRARWLQQWRRWPETLEAWRAALTEAGHGGRGADQYGTLLAAADLALHDDAAPNHDYCAIWAQKLAAGELARRADDAADHERLRQPPADLGRRPVPQRRATNHRAMGRGCRGGRARFPRPRRGRQRCADDLRAEDAVAHRRRRGPARTRSASRGSRWRTRIGGSPPCSRTRIGPGAAAATRSGCRPCGACRWRRSRPRSSASPASSTAAPCCRSR